MKSKSAGKVRLTSFDDLFGANEMAAGETVTSVPLSQLHTFKDHPFRVLDDEKMQETVESVKHYEEESGNSVSLSVDWLERARVKVVKVDSIANAKLSGAVFGIYRDKDCTDLITKMPATDKNGAAEAEIVMTQNTVYLKEITAPKGYRYNNVYRGFDQTVLQQIKNYLNPTQNATKPQEQEIPSGNSKEKQPLENWQKYMENGEYLRSIESGEEQNYSFIDGNKNNGKKKNGRVSVKKKLRQKQAEIAKRSGKLA